MTSDEEYDYRMTRALFFGIPYDKSIDVPVTEHLKQMKEDEKNIH